MSMFSAPIPGQSLTTPPKNYAWERPPEIADPEQAIVKHLDRLSDPEMLDSVLTTLEHTGIDIQTMTKGIIRGAVANGVHSIDVGLIVAPVVHEFIKQAAKTFGLEVDDGFEDKPVKEKEKQAVIAMKARKMMEKMDVSPKEVVKEIKEPVVAEEPPVDAPPMEAPPVEAEPAKGLMARGAV